MTLIIANPERLQSYQEHTYSLKQLWMRKDSLWTPIYLWFLCYIYTYIHTYIHTCTHESFKRVSEHTIFFLWDLVTFLKMQLVRFALLWETTELQLGRKIIQNKPNFTKKRTHTWPWSVFNCIKVICCILVNKRKPSLVEDNTIKILHNPHQAIYLKNKLEKFRSVNFNPGMQD